VLVTVSYYAAYRLKFDFIEFAANFAWFTRSLPIVVAVTLIAFFAVGVYQGVWRHFSSSDAVTIVKGALVGTIAAQLILLLMFRAESYSRTVFIIYGIIVVLMVVGSRASFSVMSEALQRRRETGRRIVIYGAGDGGAMAVRELLSDPGVGIRIVGFIDDDPRKRGGRVRGYPVLGPYDTLSELVVSGSVDMVVLSARAIDDSRLRQLEALCTTHAIQLSRLMVTLEPMVDPGHSVAAGLSGTSARGRPFKIAADRSADPRKP